MTKKIEQVSLFQSLSKEEMSFLNHYLQQVQYQADEVILKQGSLGGNLYLINRGQVLVKVTLPGDTMKVAATLGEGKVFGEVSFLSQVPITANIVADKTVVCTIISHDVLLMLRVAKPEMAFKIEKAIAEQAALKIISGMHRIRDFLQKLPKPYQVRCEESQFKVNPKAHCKLLTMDEIDLDFIAKIACFNQFSRKELTLILESMQLCFCRKGYCFKPPSDIAKLNVICSGATMLFIKDEKKLIEPIAVYGIGEFFIESQPFHEVASYVACEDCMYLSIDFNTYLELRVQHPALFFIFSQYMHSEIVAALYIVNRQFVRINTEYRDLLSNKE